MQAAAASLLAACAACAGKPDATEASFAESFPLPMVPSTVTDPAQRASIAAARFWDGAVLAPGVDTVTPALEQAMANFVAISAMGADADSVSRGVAVLLSKGSEDLILPLAEQYLYDPNSPLRNEEVFIPFLEQTIANPRSAALLDEVLKNRVGTPAADFIYMNSKGRQGSLSGFVAANGGAFVYFFDSECSVCKELIPTAADAADAEGLAVLAVCPEANAAKFADALDLFPDNWTAVRDLGAIDNEELYIFPALPSVYIIKPDMTVKVKDMKL